jgi:putative restriction endonuclease
MNFWWVNHKQTFEQEVPGGYIWSPKVKANGTKNHFYDNMALVQPGDVVVSYASGKISAIGIATDKASTSSKPREFGTIGDYWEDEGWFAPVEFKMLSNPIYPKDHWESLAPLMPVKYSPLNQKGKGNQGAYLASISNQVGDFLFSLTNQPLLVQHLIGIGACATIEEKNEEAQKVLEQRTDIGPTEKEQLVKSRRGQGIFKSNVELIEKGCRVTGLTLREHLRASHIKPWSVSDDKERIDGNNGLLLAPHVDHLFDKGYISFDISGSLLISGKLDSTVLALWKIDSKANVGSFTEEQQKYMVFHREHVFQR